MPQLRGQARRGALDRRVDPEERQYAGSNSSAHNSNGSGSPGEEHDHADSYASEDFVLGLSSSRERKKDVIAIHRSPQLL
ncbi:hypothetical protein SLEP1_g52189 [Rubroshorea leprosula]|uniref:Uncharacterized protein n=1 Tax=Rubroshorea leprosula TaxID=152421 RepID=A0AAV5M5H3_9ROSI|nr:hypothetical protein SLEP1_g52189 [Rubroshorea leprosula]